MAKNEQIQEMAKVLEFACENTDCTKPINCDLCQAKQLYSKGYRKVEWISVEERLPTQDEYLTHHNDGLDTLKRVTIAYMTDTIEYTIGCYDGYKWTNQLGNKKIENVVAWKPFETYEPPKMKSGADMRGGRKDAEIH